MPVRSPLVLLLGLAACFAVPAHAQPAEPMVRGIVWSPPEDIAAAAADLRAMRNAGIEAVRIGFEDRARVLRSAEREGIAIFMDMAVASLPAPRLADTLSFAERHLEAILQLAGRYPAIEAIGLAASVDTSMPEACSYFDRLTERVREAGLRAYYRTRFIESDVCSGSVDLVLLDARERDAAALLRRWQRHHDTPAAIGALGVEVDDRISGGHLTARSPAAQARFLEDNLAALRRAEDQPEAVFVHRWRGPSDGLLNEANEPRLAFSVVRGFYTGRQLVFAIDAGAEPEGPPGAPTFTVLGWVLAILLALLLSVAPRFRELIPRYFVRHGYYREAVQRSMGLEGFAALGVVVMLALAAGLVLGVMLYAVAVPGVLEAAVGGAAERQLESILATLRRPFLTVMLGALAYGFWILVNMMWLLALTGKRHRIRPMQAAVLASFSRWPLFVLALLALIAAQGGATLQWLPWLIGLWIAIEFVAGARMLYDYGKVTRVPMPRAIVGGMGIPLIALAVGAVVVMATVGPELTFLWHLATRS